jgi:FxsC-like protein
MPHVFFFSYASENRDKALEAFFEDLCLSVAPYTRWAAKDPRISIRDRDNLPLMTDWQPEILEALQTSSVLVCATSLAYLKKRFCGQKCWLFEQRRRKNGASRNVPANILPVIWAPVRGGLPPFFGSIQWRQGAIPAAYEDKGLFYLKKRDPAEYDQCVAEFAVAISSAYDSYPSMPILSDIGQFDAIPNVFADGRWEEAVGPRGWIPGPNVVNVILIAASAAQLQSPPGRYGSSPSDWRPYLPRSARTASEISRLVAGKNGFLYREIFLDPQSPSQLRDELNNAITRKNITLVVADAHTLQVEDYQDIGPAFDDKFLEGTALLMLWDDVPGPQVEATLQRTLARLFPVRTQLSAPAFHGRIRSAEEYERILEETLSDLRARVTRIETEKKAKTDQGPAVIVGPGRDHS